MLSTQNDPYLTTCSNASTIRTKVINLGPNGASDIELLTDVANVMNGRTFCPLGDGAAGVVLAMIKHFRNEFEEHINDKKCKLSV